MATLRPALVTLQKQIKILLQYIQTLCLTFSATRNGAQVQIVRRMIDRILGPDILFPENGPKAPTAARYPDRNFPTRRPLSP